MKILTFKRVSLKLGSAIILAACTQPNGTSPIEKSVTKSDSFQYADINNFNQDLAQFIGLSVGESFAAAEPKINAVFKAYDGHAAPQNISMDSEIVEGGWKQVLVTQDGLMDEAVTGQQLLAIFDNNQKLVTYGLRIKCYSESGHANWQNTLCD